MSGNRYRTITRLARNVRPGDVIIGDEVQTYDITHRVESWPSETVGPITGRRMVYVPTVTASGQRWPMHWFESDERLTIRRPVR